MNSAVYTLYSCLFKNKLNRKQDPYFDIGKKSKVMPQSHYLSLFLGEGRGSLQPSSLNHIKCAPLSDLSINPVMHLFWHTQCACGTLQNCPVFCIWTHVFFHFFHKFWTFPVTERHEILHHHFSSWFQAENSLSCSMKSMKFQLPQKKMKFRPYQIICDPGPVNWQNSMQNDTKCHTFKHLHSVTPLKSMKPAPTGKYISRILHYLHQQHLLLRS